MKWYKMMWNDIKWHEVVRNMIWNEKKGLKRIWKDIDRTEYLQSTLHKTDRSPCLDVAAAITCNNDKYLRSFLLCLRSRMAKKFKWCSITLYCKGLVEGTASCFDFYEKRALNFNSGMWQAAHVWASYARFLGKAHRSFFCLAVEHREFHVQYQFFKTYLIY